MEKEPCLSTVSVYDGLHQREGTEVRRLTGSVSTELTESSEEVESLSLYE